MMTYSANAAPKSIAMGFKAANKMGTTSAPSDLGAHALTLREVDAPFDHMKNTLDCCDPAALRQNEVCAEVVLRVVADSGLSQKPQL
jgi:hypothetical protein